MSLIKTTLFIFASLTVYACSLFDSKPLSYEYSDKNITIEITGGKPEAPGTIEITSTVEDTLLIRSLFINVCFFAYYSIEGMKYVPDLQKWIKGSWGIACDLDKPPLKLWPMETKTIDILPGLPENDYRVKMYYAVDNIPELIDFAEIELGLRVKD